MDAGYFLKCRVYAAAAWAVCGLLILSGWAVLFYNEDHWKGAGALFATGCAVSALAATLQVRSFMVRIAALIRHANGLEEEMAPNLHTIRERSRG